jgi:copper(I)-binding protein
MVGRRLLAVVACLVIAGPALTQTGQLEVSNAWARATPAKAETGIAFLTIRSPTSDRLVSVSSRVAKKGGAQHDGDVGHGHEDAADR